MNPLLDLTYEPVLASLGDDYYDEVAAADFPQHRLRFRNDDLLPLMGLDPAAVSDEQWIEAFGKFQGRSPFLALRYHGYQFGQYNPALGDGRGFLYGQLWGSDGELYDLGTKGSGPTPYSRGGDGRLTLKGGVREVLAAEALHAQGVRTSRCLSLVETGDSLWRGDEPSPTRASVMVRFSRSHIRFGTFERLAYLERSDLIGKLLDHVVAVYYPHISAIADSQDRNARFYAELVERTAELAASWMAVGFCHGVLNTDNLSITGESFDYGPYAFMDKYDPGFTAAYFDYSRRYCYGNQPGACYWGLEKLQVPLKLVMSAADLSAGLAQFEDHYGAAYVRRMLAKLGFDPEPLLPELTLDLVKQTLALLEVTPVGYHQFFLALTRGCDRTWRDDPQTILAADQAAIAPDEASRSALEKLRSHYHQALTHLDDDGFSALQQRLRATNPATVLLRPEIEAIWEPITVADNWEPFYTLVKQVQQPYLT
jgi:uncharacterized protein YdiU (UPF0061 family)